MFVDCCIICEYLTAVPELRLVVGEENAEELLEGKSDSENSPIKKSFTALMTSDDKTIKEQLAHLVARVQEASKYVQRMKETIHVAATTALLLASCTRIDNAVCL